MKEEIILQGDIDPPVKSTEIPVEIMENKPAVKENENLNLSNLPDIEKNKVLEIKETIDLNNASSIVTYGSESQNKIASFSDSVLKNVKTKDAGAAGELLSDLVVEIKSFDEATEEKSGFFGLFNSAKKRFEKINTQYAKVETNINKIVDNLEQHKRVLLKDMAMLDEMYANNYEYYKDLTLYLIAGKEKLAEINEEIIPELKKKAEETNDQIDGQKLNDMINYANRFDKKLHDLALTRMISMQMAPQIRLLQNNDAQLLDKIQSSIVNSIPLWKNQVVIALGLANSKSALESQKKVTDMTNEMLQKNSEMLKQGSLEIAQESEEGIVSIETLKKTNENLIDTINGVMEIQEKGRQDRLNAEQELIQIEDQLKQTLLQNKSS